MERELRLVRHRILYDLDRLFILLFDKIGLGIVKTFELDRAIASAMIRTHPLVYGSRIVGFTLIAALIGIAILSIGVLMRQNLVAFVSMILAGILLPLTTFTVFIAYPVIVRSRRRNLTESELLFFASYVSIMARGGIPLSRAMEAFRRSSLFAGIRMEAQEFFRRIGFGRDPITALEEISFHHPSQIFRDFMLGYIITFKTGGDIVRYLETRVEDLFRRQSEIIRQMIQRLGVYIEVYMLISIVGGLGIFVLSTSAGVIQVGGTPAGGFDPTVPILFNFVGLPLLSAAILYAAHLAQPRWRLIFREVIYIGLLAFVIAPLTYLTVIIATGGYHVFSGIYTRQTTMGQVLGFSAALLTVSMPTWLAYRRATKGLRALERAVALYIENVSEFRETGLSPERSFVEASKRDYGPLNPIVRRIAASIEMGIDLEEAVRRSLYGVGSWLVRVIFKFAIDSVKAGGGSPEIFYLLARYASSISEAYERLKTGLRIYVIAPYIGAILFVITSIVYLSLVIAQPIPSIGGMADVAAIHRLALIASVASITNAWIMGIVAGKISGLSMGEGFKHATIITLITTIMIVIFAQLFLPP